MRQLFTLCLVLLISTANFAKGGEKKPVVEDSSEVSEKKMIQQMAELEKSLNYEHGEVKLEGGIASINVPVGFKFLGAVASHTWTFTNEQRTHPRNHN